MAKNIHEAILEVMKQVGYVQKTGKMGGGARYSYASEADLISALRPAMIEAEIVAHPHYVLEVLREQYTTSGGNVMNDRVVTIRWNFVHAPSETSIQVDVVGEGSDSGDKACNKAMTAAMKYALRQTFLIETGDDPDQDASDPQVPAGLPADTKARPGRKKNQWESNVLKAIGATNTIDNRKHAVNRLNHSCLFKKDFGAVTPVEGVAYMMAWNEHNSKHPTMDAPEQAKAVDAMYEKWIGKATDLIASTE